MLLLLLLQAERLRALSVASSRMLEALRAKLARGESILKLAELVRKYETEGEQVLPFYSSAEAAQAEALDAQVSGGCGGKGGGGGCTGHLLLLLLQEHTRRGAQGNPNQAGSYRTHGALSYKNHAAETTRLGQETTH